MKKIIILDISTQAVHVLDYDTNIYPGDVEDALIDIQDAIGEELSFGDLSWMIVDKLEIQIH